MKRSVIHRHPALFTSTTDEWSTPEFLFKALDAEFGFELDVCATPANAKCKRFFTRETDGLKQQWTGVVWMNPPYGRTIGKWVAKAYESAQQGATVVALLPSRTDTKVWHRYVMLAEIRFLQGRLKFGNATASAPFPSAIAIWRRRPVIASMSVAALANQFNHGQTARRDRSEDQQ